MMENLDNLPVKDTKSPTTPESPETPKSLKSVCRSNDTSGDWTKTSENLHINSRDLSKEIANLEAESAIESKHKNVYSIPTPNGHSTFWSTPLSSSRRSAAMTSANILLNKFDRSAEDEDTNYLDAVRECLVNYQESCGTPRGEYTFASLIKLMGQAIGRSVLAVFYVVVNITPIAEIFLYILRFVLDKVISIRNTTDYQQAALKSTILGLQLVCIYVCLVFIFGFILMPIIWMIFAILAKIMLYG